MEAWIRRRSIEHEYDQDAFERAYRLAQLLREIGEDEWLATFPPRSAPRARGSGPAARRLPPLRRAAVRRPARQPARARPPAMRGGPMIRAHPHSVSTPNRLSAGWLVPPKKADLRRAAHYRTATAWRVAEEDHMGGSSKLTFVWGECRKFPNLDRWMASNKEIRETVIFQRTGPGRGASKGTRLFVQDYLADHQFKVELQERAGRAMLHVKYRLGEQFLLLCTLGSFHRHNVDPSYSDPCTQEMIIHGNGYEKRRCHDCEPDWGHRTHEHLSRRDLSIFFMEAISHLRVTKHGAPPIREKAITSPLVDDPEGYR